MNVTFLSHDERKNKMGFKPAFLVNDTLESPRGGPVSRGEQPPALENREIPGYLNKVTNQAKFDALVRAKELYNASKRNLHGTLHLRYFDKEEQYLDINATLANLDELLDKSRAVVRKKDKVQLLEIKRELVNILTKQSELYPEGPIGVQEALDPQAIRKHGELLLNLDKDQKERREAKNTWSSTEIYKTIGQTYDDLVAESSQFESLTRDLQGRLDPEHAAENKALFMTLMEAETLGFTQKPSAKTDGSEEGVEPQTEKEILEAALLRFQEAMKQVDQQGGQGNLGELYNPSIRRLLISNFYESEGVAAGEEAIGPLGNAWILSQLSQSPYFNKNAPAESGIAQKQALEVAFAGGEAAQRLSDQQKEIEAIDALIKTSPLWEDIEKSPVGMGLDLEGEEKLHGSPQAFLESRKMDLVEENQGYEDFLILAQDIIQHPYDESNTPHAELTRLNLEGDGGLGLIEKGQLDTSKTKLEKMGIAYNLVKKENEGGIEGSFDAMGLNLDRTYGLYVRALISNPDIDVRNWDQLLSQNPGKMADILQVIIPPSQQKGGQEARTALISLLRGMQNPSTDPAINQYCAVVTKEVSEIKQLILEQNSITAKKIDVLPKIEEAMKGSKGIKENVMGVYNKLKSMLFSGDTFDMVLAGTTFFILGSVIYKGFKNTGTWWGKAIVGASAIAGGGALYEHFSGNKLGDSLEKAGPDAVEAAAEGTQELAVVNEGKKWMNRYEGTDKEKNVSANEHLRAEIVLGKVPYHYAMEWYLLTSQPNYDVATEERLYRKMGINPNEIVKDSDKVAQNRRVRHVLHETFAYSLQFIGAQKNFSQNETERYMAEVWIKPIEDKDFTPSDLVDSAYPRLYQSYHGRQTDLTYGEVMKNYVGIHWLKKAIPQEPYGPAVAAAQDVGSKLKAGAGAVVDYVASTVTSPPENPQT